MKLQKVMKKNQVFAIETHEKRIAICVKVPPSLKIWMDSMEISPTALVRESCKELGYRNKRVK